MFGFGGLGGLGGMMGKAYGAPAGSQSEWDAFGSADFDDISNEGVVGSVTGNTGGLSTGNMMGLMGGDGYGSKFAQAQAPDMSNYANIQSLMQMGQMTPQQQNNQNLQRQQLQQGVGGMDPRIQSLMMRGMGG